MCSAGAQGCLGSAAGVFVLRGAPANVRLSQLPALVALAKGPCVPRNNVGLKFSRSLCNTSWKGSEDK